MTNKRFVLSTMLALSVMLFFACSKSDDDSNDNNPSGTDEFKKGMLVNYADNIIIPGYTDFIAKMDLLEAAVNAFLDNPSAATRDALKAPFKTAYLAFENVSMPYFGPAAALQLNSYVNTFPAATSKIEAGVASGTYNFTQPGISDSLQGLPALDYLLFSDNAVEKFTTDTHAANRKKYVRDVMDRIATLSGNALSQWNSSYRTTFVNSLKTDVGSSIGSIVNQLAFEMDALKGPRIGYPFGKQSNGIVFADKAEAYFSGISGGLAVANLTALKNYYTGASGDGIADYLVLLKKEQLNTDVLAQFDIAINALKAIPAPLSEAFTGSPATVEEAYKQIQKLLTLLKTDVASATGVQITYMDNDGD